MSSCNVNNINPGIVHTATTIMQRIIINVINYICDFPARTNRSVCQKIIMLRFMMTPFRNSTKFIILIYHIIIPLYHMGIEF